MALHEGEIVGQYQVIGQLGQGGMATVYKAYHPKLDRNVAIKVLHPAFKEDADFLARFEREAQIVAKLEHPHIVPVYDYAEHQGQPYLVMKFIEGRTLKRVLQEAPISLAEILRIMTAVASALTYAHEHGVLHRDIKPSNIVIDKHGTPFLTDFGLARIAQAGASTMSADMILGTPQYISPEQAAGLGNLDSRTDIYSLGVILYEMVVGRVPFNADTPYAIVHQHIYNPLPRPTSIDPSIPQAVEDVLTKGLAKQPADRYPTANAMIAAFRAAIEQSDLVDLNPERAKLAQDAFVRGQYEGPTITDQRAVGIPAAIPPKPPVPPVPLARGKNAHVEFELNLEKMGEAGRKVEQGIKKSADWLGRMASQIESAVNESAKDWNKPISEEEKIRRKIEKRYKERQGFLAHLMIYVIINILLWGVWIYGLPTITGVIGDAEFTAIANEFPWVILVTFGWGIGVISHFFDYYNKYGPGADRREDAIQREIQRQKERSLVFEKPKNDADRRTRLELSDDGEIIEVEDEISRAQKRKR